MASCVWRSHRCNVSIPKEAKNPSHDSVNSHFVIFWNLLFEKSRKLLPNKKHISIVFGQSTINKEMLFGLLIFVAYWTLDSAFIPSLPFSVASILRSSMLKCLPWSDLIHEWSNSVYPCVINDIGQVIQPIRNMHVSKLRLFYPLLNCLLQVQVGQKWPLELLYTVSHSGISWSAKLRLVHVCFWRNWNLSKEKEFQFL